MIVKSNFTYKYRPDCFMYSLLLTTTQNISVGGGSAGAVLANRLSEDPENSVLLLEAGPEETAKHIAEIPLAAIDLQRSDIDWSYQIEPQKNACHSFINNVRVTD